MKTEALEALLERLDYGPAPESDSAARAWLARHKKSFGHLINGRWVEPSTGRSLETTCPATGEVLAKFAHGSEADVDAAVQAAHGAFPAWSALPGFERAKYLYALARALAKHSRLFAVLEAFDNGKTIRETRDIDIPLAIRHAYYFAGWAQILAQEFPHHRPGGVVAQVIPWNFPLLMALWKIAAAIAAGNTVVLKPAEFTPLTALLLAEILQEEVKLPPGVVNIVTGDGETGKALVQHPVPWKIAFTGSTDVGREIRRATAGKNKRLTMELGGKSPFVVMDDADMDSVVEGVVDAIWFNQGQVCCAGSRLLVQEGMAGELIEKLKLRMANLRGGHPLDKTMDVGAVNSAAQFEKITGLIGVGEAEGAIKWQSPNWSCPTGGFFVPPTIFTGVEPSMTIAQEEIFGPVLVVMTFRTPAEAVALANNTRYGLAASVWSQSIDTALYLAREIKAGTVWVNCTNMFDGAVEFGGYRESGYGREGGRTNMLDVLVEEFPATVSVTLSGVEPADGSAMAEIGEGDLVDRTFRHFVGGKLVRPDGGASFQIRSPSGAILGVMSRANRKDVRNAVQAARSAAPSLANMTAHARAQILYFLAENLSAQEERFVRCISLERGCSLKAARVEFRAAVERLFHWAAYTDKFCGTVQPVPARMLVTALKEPIGVMGIRTPDDMSFLGFISSVAAAMAMGNAVVVVTGKYPISILDFIQVIQNSDVPAGWINLLTDSDPDAVGKMLAEHEDVDAVWFFGSAEGSRVVELASACNMKRTLVSNGRSIDWFGHEGRSTHWLAEVTHVKSVWVPYGV